MPTKAAHDAQTVQSSFQKLSKAANNLNQATDRLGVTIGALDEALATLNIGVTAWITFNSYSEDEDSPWSTSEQLGYAKVNGRKGLSLRIIEVDLRDDAFEVKDLWPFRDAPRELRLSAISHIPDLIDNLSIETEKAANRVLERTKIAEELAKAINASAIAVTNGPQL